MATLKTMITDWLRLKTQNGTPATPAAGYSNIYEEGGALKLIDDAGTVTTFGASTVSDTAYDATSWNGVTTIAPSKNAVRDKIEDMVSDTAYGAGWDGVTTIAPSKNAVYDKINSLPSVLNDYIKVSDTQAANTAGGTFTSGAWRTRVINTEDSDTGGHCTVGSNQITLVAGTYTCRISAPAFYVSEHQAILYNATDAANVLIGTSEVTGRDGIVGTTTRSIICGKFTLAASKALEVRHSCTTTQSTNGFGSASNFGVSEIYTVAEFWKVA